MAKRIFYLFNLLILFTSSCRVFNSSRQVEVVVEFQLTTSKTYCGGARPSEEILQQLATEKPLANFQFFIKSGVQNDPAVSPIYSSISDQEGLALASLPPGKYLVVFENKVDWTTYNELVKSYQAPTDTFDAIDTTCLKDWIKQPESVFEVVDGQTVKVQIKRQERCFWNAQPCLNYIGSLPY